jgi:hypothetical protein
MTPEGKVKALVKAWLKERNAYAFMPVQTGYGVATLDFLCCIHGRFVAIETKAPGGKLTPRQQRTMAEIASAGGIAWIVRGVDDLQALALRLA